MNFKTKVSSRFCFFARHSSNIFWKRSFFQCLFENKKCTVFLSFCHQLSVGASGIKPKTLHPHPQKFWAPSNPKNGNGVSKPQRQRGGGGNQTRWATKVTNLGIFRIFSTFFLQFGASISCQAPLAQWIFFWGGNEGMKSDLPKVCL